MRTSFFRLTLLALLGPLALVGCVRETEIEAEPDGETEVDTDYGIDEREAEATLDSAGAALERAGEAVQEGVQDAVDAIDDNVDVGENAQDDDGR